MNRQTYKTRWYASLGIELGEGNRTSQPTGYEKGVPYRFWAPDSWEWLIECWEDQGTTKLVLTSGTAVLYIAANATGATETQIGTGAIGTGDNTNQVTYTVQPNALPTELYGVECVLIARVTASGYARTAIQYVVPMHSSTGTGSTTTNASLFLADALFSPAGTTVEGYIYHLADDGLSWVLSDPDTAKTEACELFVAGGTDPETDGMYAEALIDGTFTTRGAALYLDDGGAVTETVPSSPDDEGRVCRIVGWVRSATSARFHGHRVGWTMDLTEGS